MGSGRERCVNTGDIKDSNKRTICGDEECPNWNDLSDVLSVAGVTVVAVVAGVAGVTVVAVRGASATRNPIISHRHRHKHGYHRHFVHTRCVDLNWE